MILKTSAHYLHIEHVHYLVQPTVFRQRAVISQCSQLNSSTHFDSLHAKMKLMDLHEVSTNILQFTLTLRSGSDLI